MSIKLLIKLCAISTLTILLLTGCSERNANESREISTGDTTTVTNEDISSKTESKEAEAPASTARDQEEKTSPDTASEAASDEQQQDDGMVDSDIFDKAKTPDEFDTSKELTFYDNGVVIAKWPENSELAQDFEAINIYELNEKGKGYNYVGAVEAWEKNYAPSDQEGINFPDELDTDGDGILYTISYKREYFYSYTNNQTEYDSFMDSLIGNAHVVRR